jgi:hypothetical protein
MHKRFLVAVLYSTLLVAAPCWGLDYEAKPVAWVLKAPFRAVGALSAAVVGAGASGPVDGCYHGFLKGTKGVASKLGDDKSAGCLVVGTSIGGPPGAVVGTAYGVQHGFFHGLKTGWNKPFSRWSYITAEEKE